jgi:hypothetical protein
MIAGEHADMYGQTQRESGKQCQLAFDPNAMHANKLPLRLAYERLQLSRQLTFEQAMSVPIFAIGIRNLADAMSRPLTKSRMHIEWKD